MFIETKSFWTINIGHLIDIAVLMVAALAYLLSRKTESRERRDGMAKAVKDREEALALQVKMHTENQQRMEVLLQFQEVQKLINEKRDIQIVELSKQTATLTEMVRGQDRRLQLLETSGKRRAG